MGRLVWAPSAIEDADLIAQYIARDSVDQAALFVARLFAATERLIHSPESGRIIPELNDPQRREIMVGAYRVMYYTETSDVWIVAIVHGARDWPHAPAP